MPVTHLVRTILLALSLLAVPAALLPAADAATPCSELISACVYRQGACVWVASWPAIDFGLGAGNCPEASVGSGGVRACETAWAGMGTIGGFQGVIVNVCAVQDDTGGVCVTSYGQVGRDPTVFDPLCLA